jgi:phosphate acyltransferase
MDTPGDPPNAAGLPNSGSTGVILSVDAMGGDLGPKVVIDGVGRALASNAGLHILLHGDEGELLGLMSSLGADAARVEVVHAPGVVAMGDKPSHVMRHGKDTSMWSTIAAVKSSRAEAAVSCGNTGALMAISMLQLRRMEGVSRPAIACLWPSRSKHGFSTMLDVGADIRAEASDLLTYAMMGATYFRNGFTEPRPRVGLLNVGTEDHKGRAEIRHAHDLIAECAEIGRYDFVGFIEGSDIPSGKADVIVTDGFTGNVALKTAEGTARLIADFMREEMLAGWFSRIGALLAGRAFANLRLRTDPRRYNGGVFLGLNGTVVKSHGAADAAGVASALGLAAKLTTSGYRGRMAERLVYAEQAAKESSDRKDNP